MSRTPVALPPITENARPTLERISAAASELAKRPRPWQRKWTGVLHGERLRRRTLVQVPTGDVLAAYVVLRQKVIVIAPEQSGRLFDQYDASEVRRIMNPAAQLLGRLKGGKKERPSVLKAIAARRNGCMPPRPGRRRGRPRRQAAAAGPPPSPM